MILCVIFTFSFAEIMIKMFNIFKIFNDANYARDLLFADILYNIEFDLYILLQNIRIVIIIYFQ